MVNLTYGVLAPAPAGGSSDGTLLTPLGTDLIATTADGTVIAYSPGDIAWVLCCTALVWVMIPALGYLYSGLVRRKNALHLLLVCFMCMSCVSFTWWFWGYSLAFSATSGTFLGNLNNFCFMGVLEKPASGANNKIPEIVYAIYQNMFAALVPAIAIGAAAERGRVAPIMPFIFCWVTLVYCPIVAWIWNPNGWAYKWGVLDYAGGVPVEVLSGTTGLVYSLFLGHRRGFGTERLSFRPHNVSHVVMGTTLLWFGWLGFNGGSTFAANLKAALAIVNTNLAGSTASMTWLVLDYRFERKWSVVGFCTGAIVGLVAITPAAGYVGSPAAALIGVVAAGFCNWMTKLKVWLKFDDAMDIFAAHGLAGMVGLLMTGLFAQSSVTFNDAISEIDGGWLDQNYKQLYKQLVWILVGFCWCFVVTYLIMFVINLVPGLHFRADEVGEIVGMDEDQLGEFAYDFVFQTRDLEGHYHQDLQETSSSNEERGRTSSKEIRVVENGNNGNGAGGDPEKKAGLDQRGAPAINGQSGGHHLEGPAVVPTDHAAKEEGPAATQ